MKKAIIIIYVSVCIFFCALVFYIGVADNNILFDLRTDDNYTILQDYSVKQVETPSAPYGQAVHYLIDIPNIPQVQQSLSFYTLHQNVFVYIDGERIYENYNDESKGLGKSSGYLWQHINLFPEDSGKTITVEIQSPYKQNIDLEPTFYLGDKMVVFFHVLILDAPLIVFGIAVFIVGITFAVISISIRSQSGSGSALIYLSAFAIVLGIWQTNDLRVISWLLPNQIIQSYISFLSLMMVPIPFAAFMQQICESKKFFLWKYVYLISFANMLICVFLQLFKIADLRETVWITHVSFVLIITIVLICLFKEWRTNGMHTKLKLHVLCFCICICGITLDIVMYYNSQGYSAPYFVVLGCLIYILIMGITYIKEARKLVEKAFNASFYERMAFQDGMTGLLNRNAWLKWIEKENRVNKDCVIIVFDLNDLKKYNDVHGHERGDEYIRQSAKLIKNFFSPAGDSYRIGGDEFAVVLMNMNGKNLDEVVAAFENEIQKYNDENKDLKLGISYGYATFDKNKDHDLDDVINRADIMMYENKRKLKGEN